MFAKAIAEKKVAWTTYEGSVLSTSGRQQSNETTPNGEDKLQLPWVKKWDESGFREQGTSSLDWERKIWYS